jgi:hypothetical protein
MPRGGITVCAACGKPRTGTVMLGGTTRSSVVPASHLGRSASTSAMLDRGRGRAQRLFGVLSLGAGVAVAAAAAALFAWPLGLGLAAAAGLLGVGVGATSMRAGARSMRRADEQDQRARHEAVHELAAKRRGRLTARDVAQAFGLSEPDADALLTSMVGDGSSVTVDVDDEGVVRYLFLELLEAPAVRARVEVEQALDASAAGAQGELEAEASRAGGAGARFSRGPEER